MNQNRMKSVEDLVKLRRPIRNCLEELRNFEWDYDGRPFVLSLEIIFGILERYLNGDLSARNLEEWASAIELRDDIEVDSNDEDLIKEIIEFLSEPSINGSISKEIADGIIKYKSIKV